MVAPTKQTAQPDKVPDLAPPGWGEDKLSTFLQVARDNEFATFHNKRTEYELLRDIDDCYLKLADNLLNTKAMVPALLFYRSHAAYRGSCRTALAGQATETFVDDFSIPIAGRDVAAPP
jgi:hypothetical protein